jgi:hypothetical protein
MVRKMIGTMLALAIGLLVGCGGGGGGPAFSTVDIASSGGVNDGDILRDPFQGQYTLATNATFDNIFVGTSINSLDPTNPASDFENRGFLTFDITQIPFGSVIRQATVALRVNRVSPFAGNSVTLFPDLVTFPRLDTLTTQLSLTSTFDLADRSVLLAGPSLAVPVSAEGTDVFLDVTDALVSAGNRGFSTMQLRLIGTNGQVVVDDISFPPLLSVTFR